MNRRPIVYRACACLLSSALGLLASCSPSRVATGLAYPTNKPQTRTINIQVTRQETQLALTNTTAERLEGGTLWLNAQYARPAEPLEIGQTVVLDLRQFRNEHDEIFRAGGFFATMPPARVVQVQLETEQEMIGFVIVGDRTP